MTSADEILALFGRAAAKMRFPFFDNGYLYPVDARLSLFRDDTRWAMIIETLTYSPREANPATWLHVYGNCLSGADSVGDCFDDYIVYPVENFEDVVDEEENYTGADLVVRGRTASAGAPAGSPIEAALRAAVPPHRELFLADESELRHRIPADLPLILRLDEWHHPDGDFDDFAPEVLASDTFARLAEVLATGDVTRYRPSRVPNTHWSNWPEAGTL